MLELYHFAGSVCARKVRLALAEKGIADWESHIVDIINREQFKPEFVKLNPKSLVPVLVHNGRVLTESMVICEYLDDIFPKPQLRPSDPYDAAMMRIWAKSPEEELHTACTAVSFAGLLGRFRRQNPDLIAKQVAAMTDKVLAANFRGYALERWQFQGVRNSVLAFDRVLKRMEKALSENGPWIIGASFSLGDIALIPYVYRLHECGLEGMWSNLPHVADWLERVMKRPSFAEAIGKYPGPYMAQRDPKEDAEDWMEVQKILAAAA